jgi:hypothetical protein
MRAFRLGKVKMEDWLQKVTREGALLLGQDFKSHEKHKKVCRQAGRQACTCYWNNLK